MLSNTSSEEILVFLDSLNIPVLMLDARDRVVSTNDSACRLFQYTRDDLSGKGLCDIMTTQGGTPVMGGVYSPSVPPASSGMGNAVEGLSEMTGRKKNGDRFVAGVSVVPSKEGGFKLAVIQDVSDRKRLQLRASQRTKELSIFNTFAGILNKNFNRDTIIRESIETLPSMMGGEMALIHLRDARTGNLYLKAHAGCSREDLREIETLRSGEGLSGRVLSSGRPLLVDRASEDPRVTNLRAELLGIESIAAVPISSKGVVRGVFAVASRAPSRFTSMDMQLFSTLGSQLGVAIENSELIKELQEKMRQIELTNELSSMINSSLSIGTVFRIMVSEIRHFVKYDRASLLLYDEKEDCLTIFALDTQMETVLPKGIRAPIEGTSAGWVVRHNRPWINRDLGEEIRFRHDRKLRDDGIRSTVSIPLYKDRMLGVFNLDSTQRDKYSERDLQFLRPVAKHISIALENALLFEEISKEKKEWERTFDAITDMVWIEDLKQQVIRANRALLKYAGLSLPEVTGERCAKLLKRIGIPTAGCLCGETLLTRRQTFLELKGEDGSIFHFWAYPLIDEEGRLYAIVHYLKDVTTRKRLEEQLVRADKLASLGTLVAGIAHEINNPLGIIAGYAEALLDRAKDRDLLNVREFEDFPEYLETIHQEIFRCKEILGSLLEFSGPHRVKARELDVNELIKEVILLVNHKAKRLHHHIKPRLKRDIPKIYAEPGSLRQLFMNIIINSMYHTPEGGSIEIISGLDETEGGREDRRIQVVIRDNGSGIPPEIIGRIFDPFFTTKPIGEGTGLGLAICHKIAEEHGGMIDVKSTVGEGTTFIIKLPAKGAHGQIACCG